MTERGLPIVGGAPACPFVAFADDRDERATSPDHRHRCYAEAEPAPRALAHQEAYCLSSAFPVCPTFQDWARREAAKARPGGSHLGDGVDDDDADDDADFAPLVEDRPPRRSGHQWSAPPPWLSGQSGGPGRAPDSSSADAGPVGPGPGPAAAGAGAAGMAAGGLAGSFADRLASHTGEPAVEPEPEPDWEEREAWDEGHDEGHDEGRPPSGAPPAGPARRRGHERIDPAHELDPRERDVYAPSWERPRRLEAYPTLRSRRLSALVLPPLMLALVAILLAAAALFFLPSLLGLVGGPSGSPTPAPSATAGPSVSNGPSVAPAATPQTYTVQAGDTMSKIANRFHVPLAALIDANRATVPNPDKLAVGDVLIIPTATPSELPGASTAP